MMTRTKLAVGAGAAALALSACGAVAAAADQTVHHRASHISAHQNQAATNATYEADVVKAKQDLWRRLAQHAGAGKRPRSAGRGTGSRGDAEHPASPGGITGTAGELSA